MAEQNKIMYKIEQIKYFSMFLQQVAYNKKFKTMRNHFKSIEME